MSMTGQGEVLFELTRVGHVVRVTAFDTATLREVTIQGPATAGEAVLRRVAMGKLDYVNRKLATQTGRGRPV